MPSLHESRLRVKEGLKQSDSSVDHDAILSSLQDEIDRHNAVRDDIRSSMRKHRHKNHENGEHEEEEPERTMRFRFKSGTKDPNQRRKQHSTDHSHRSKRRKHADYPTPPQDTTNSDTAHPFPREPVINPDTTNPDPNEAFRTSLFDALADDEGAAYWESVYSQPIHIYPRPAVATTTAQGGGGGALEAMSDAEYVEYVKTKMWDRKNPDVVAARERKAKEKRAEEEERTRRREEFVRRRARAAWERAQGWRGRDNDDDGHVYQSAGDANLAPSDAALAQREYADAWAKYLAAWDGLKYDLLAERGAETTKEGGVAPSKRIPWPVVASKPVVRANIEAFMRNAPSDAQRSRMQILKAERVRWHPDKVQQRFAGAVDEGTMKLVTGVFQVVDALHEEERKRS